jgi:hypothetical protein
VSEDVEDKIGTTVKAGHGCSHTDDEPPGRVPEAAGCAGDDKGQPSCHRIDADNSRECRQGPSSVRDVGDLRETARQDQGGQDAQVQTFPDDGDDGSSSDDGNRKRLQVKHEEVHEVQFASFLDAVTRFLPGAH